MVDAVAGYERGPDATVRAGAAALEQTSRARAVVLVEGVSDQIAVDAAAQVQGCDLGAEGVVVLPIGGAQAVGRTLGELGRRLDGLAGVTVAGLCDVAEEGYFRRAIGDAGLGEASDRAALERCGFFVCVDDLEDELLRAAGPACWAR